MKLAPEEREGGKKKTQRTRRRNGKEHVDSKTVSPSERGKLGEVESFLRRSKHHFQEYDN